MGPVAGGIRLFHLKMHKMEIGSGSATHDAIITLSHFSIVLSYFRTEQLIKAHSRGLTLRNIPAPL